MFRRRDTGTPAGWAFMLPICLGASLNPINSSIIATALSPIAQAMGVPVGRTAALIAALYVASAVCQPVTGRMAQVFGPRRVFLVGSCIVLAGGTLGMFATSLETLIVARALIGIGTSAGYPSAMLLIHRQAAATGAAPGRKFGALAIAAQVSVTLGLPLGGLLVGSFGWATTFAVNVPLSLAVIASTLLWVPPDATHNDDVAAAGHSIRQLDTPGMILFAATLTAAVVFLLSLRHPHWMVLCLATVLVVCLVMWEGTRQTPFFDVRSLRRNPALTATYLRNCATMLVMYSTLFGVSQWLQELRGLDAASAGLLIVPMTAVAAVVSFGAARSDRVKGPLVASGAAALIATTLMSAMSERTPLAFVAAATMALGVMVGLSAIGNQAALYAQARSDELGIAAGLLRTSTNVGAILAASVVSLAFADGATDGHFRALCLFMALTSAAVVAGTAADRTVPRLQRG